MFPIHSTIAWFPNPIITHAPLFWGGEDYVCESPLGDSSFVMNIHNPFMHCMTSQYVFIMLLHAVTTVTTWQQHQSPHRHQVASLYMACFTTIHQRDVANCEFEKICNVKYIKSTRQKSSQFRFYIISVWWKRERMSACEMTVKRTRQMLLDCTHGFAGRAIQ